MLTLPDRTYDLRKKYIPICVPLEETNSKKITKLDILACTSETYLTVYVLVLVSFCYMTYGENDIMNTTNPTTETYPGNYFICLWNITNNIWNNNIVGVMSNV
jgi:hypothetical protein